MTVANTVEELVAVELHRHPETGFIRLSAIDGTFVHYAAQIVSVSHSGRIVGVLGARRATVGLIVAGNIASSQFATAICHGLVYRQYAFSIAIDKFSTAVLCGTLQIDVAFTIEAEFPLKAFIQG